jgi:indolepyruvate ferredoxin oxidoreductase alpha subunit
MSAELTLEETGSGLVLLGDEAVGLGALHAGISAAYAYPGTPSTEILEYILKQAAPQGRPRASWAVNEKTAYEQALGTSMAGQRALVAMKHVGLNVAADPFMNSAIIGLDGGLVVVVADDPGMHSSQNEQDSRYYADFARTLCLEPTDQQETYAMTREAFELSERFRVPVLLRLVTHLAHSRAPINPRPPRDENPVRENPDRAEWILLPAFARPKWHRLLALQRDMRAYSECTPHNSLRLSRDDGGLGVITTGIARNYLLECLPDLELDWRGRWTPCSCSKTATRSSNGSCGACFPDRCGSAAGSPAICPRTAS